MADTEKKPKRSKKSPDVPAAPAPAKAEKAEKPPKKPKHRVEHVGNTIVCAGREVTVRAMTPDEQKKAGIKSMTSMTSKGEALGNADAAGSFGVPLDGVELTFTFKSPKAASAFFQSQLEAEENEIIEGSGKVEWYSDDLNDMLTEQLP